MKATILGLAAAVCLARAAAAADAVEVRDLSLEGEIEGENIVFTLAFRADVPARGARMDLVRGDVAFLEGELPRGAALEKEPGGYALSLRRGRGQPVRFRFASRAAKEGDWRRTGFTVPVGSIRKLAVVCDRDDLEIRFLNAMKLERERTKDGRARLTAFLGTWEQFGVSWKPEVRKLAAELVATSDANTIAAAGVGALRIDTVYTFRVVQGSLTELAFDLPEMNVTQVRGEDIREWRIDRTAGSKPRLVVALGRPKEDLYRLQVEGEMALPQFPCGFDLPVLRPLNMIRSSGFLAIGSDSAVKLTVARAGGLTQVDPAMFPAVALDSGDARKPERPRPTRSPYTYQYANMPYTLALTADDIVTALTADDRLVLTLEDNELALDASIELDVKDAPAREILIEMDTNSEWTVTDVSGQNVSDADTDVRDVEGARVIFVPFTKAVAGPALVNVRLERSLPAGAADFRTPRLRVRGAKTERGYVVAAAEKGVRLKAVKSQGLQEVFTGSAPMRVEGAQQAFRFKEPGWTLEMAIDRAPASINCEVFHLASLGEGVEYCSAAVTYHIGGAPVQEFRVRVPAAIEAPEFTGADIESWTRSEEVCTVRLRGKILGDYTLLVTYDRQFDYKGSEIPVGGIHTLDTESEVGYVAVASSASLKIEEAAPPPASVIRIDRGEIPTAYSASVTDPILRSYKYVRTPHEVRVRVAPYATEQLLGQIADYVRLSTQLTRDGEAVTTAMYYLKNASRQYVVARLPQGAKLWSIRRVDENGTRTDVLSQESDEGILIPLTRPRDPNTALRIEITYAESLGRLGFWSSGVFGLRLTAAQLPSTHATFASWNVEAPEGFAIAGSGGMMTRTCPPRRGGLRGAVSEAFRILGAILDGPGGGRVLQALASGWGGTRSDEFTRTVNLSDEEPLALPLRVVPAWVGAAGRGRGLVAGVALGLAFTIWALWRRRSAAAVAAGLTVLAAGAAQSAAGQSALAAVIAAAVAVVVLRVGWRVAKSAAARGGRLAWRVVRGAGTGVGRTVAGAWRALRRSRERAYLRKLELRMAFEKGCAGATPPPADTPDKGGHATPALLLALTWAALTAIAAVAADKAAAPPQAAPSAPQTGAVVRAPALASVDLTVDGPATGRDAEPSATVSAALDIEADEPFSFLAAPSNAVLTDCVLGSRRLALRSERDGYWLDVGKAGRYRVTLQFQVGVREQTGSWQVAFQVPASLRTRATLRLPQPDLDIQSDGAVMLRPLSTATNSQVEAFFGPVGRVQFAWRPRVRTAKLEEAVFFCEANTCAMLLPGLVELANLIRYQVAQGEVSKLRLLIPEGMSVTAVSAPGLATWSFDPEKRALDAILENAVSGEFTLSVITQVACEGLPYAARLGVPRVADASRQRGSLALVAADAVQVRVGETAGVNPMNVEDFSPEALAAAQKPAASASPHSVRRAFRYHQAEEVSVAVETERVLPEVRVEETGSLSIADERAVLSSALALEVAKAGVFSVDLAVPEGYDVESLSGPDVSQWDEWATNGERTVTVRFTRRVTDRTQVNLVAARTGKGIEPTIRVPRVAVKDARKHTGRMTVSAERGVRLTVQSQHGVDVKKASEEGVRQAGALVFDILRPGWEIALGAEVQAPQVKPETLQWVDLTEGMLQCRAFVRQKIENAGVKTFQLRAPAPGVTLTVTGPNIARVHESDPSNGLWQVDLHGKAEDLYAMTVSYQVPYAPEDKRVIIRPLGVLGTEGQRGYLVVTCGGRVQVEPSGETDGLKPEDPRSIPSEFGAGDLSGAILCYRTVRDDYALNLSVVRHRSADVLPASIERVRMTSVVSRSRKVLTRMVLEMRVGDLRFLKMALPDPADTLWTALVNGKEVAVSRDGDLHCIPLEEQEPGQGTTVDLIYAGGAEFSALSRRQGFRAPKFADLPLDDIEWVFFVPPGFRYSGFGGTMERREGGSPLVRVFDAGQYREWNQREREAVLQKAKQVLDAGEQMVETGQRKMAKKAFQQALNYSQGQADLNEDARVQLRNLVKQQVKIGLVNRRDALRVSKNISGEKQTEQLAGFRDGDYTQEYAASVEGRLTERDNGALEVVADKIIDQQAAAAGVLTGIRVTIPEHGEQLVFGRAVQVDPKADLSVEFRAGRGWLAGLWRGAWPPALLFAGLAFVLRRRG